MLAQFMAYLPLGGLLPRPPPDGLPVWLGPLAGVACSLQEKCNEVMIFFLGGLVCSEEGGFRLQKRIEIQLAPWR